MTLYYLNASEEECERVLEDIERGLGIPRYDDEAGVAHASRWDVPRQTVGGLWGFKLKPRALAQIAIADRANVQDLPSLPDWTVERRWQPVVIRARWRHSAMPSTAGATALYDGAGVSRRNGTRYARADGLTWHAQPIVTLGGGARYVIALWVKIRGSASDEKALLDQVTAAMLSAGTIVRAIECKDSDGCWTVKGGLQGEGALASSWPPTWRRMMPGDAPGAPTGDAVILGQVV